jgi:multicomponent Na+:H+ antiporter subunit E
MIKKRIVVFVWAFWFWLLITASFAPGEMIAGLIVAAVTAWFFTAFSKTEALLFLFNPVKLFFFIIYIPVFFWELIKANLDLAYRTLHPALPINPGIVKIPTEIKSDLGLALLANSITLTPGTITADITQQSGKTYLFIHWINVKSSDEAKNKAIIAGKFERLIRRIFP